MANLSRAHFEGLDGDDPLAGFRDEFDLPGGLIYLNGNSLGAMPKAAAARSRQVVEQEWAEGLIGSMNAAGWWDLPVRLGRKLAPLVGAAPEELVLTDTTSIDLFKVMAAALELRPDRRVVVMEGSNFPTNNYVVEGLLGMLGRGHTIRYAEADEIDAAIDEDVAAICLTHVHYRTGFAHDMATLTAKAHAAGAVAVWDVCHSAGVMPVKLDGCGVDFAVGCTYKYLNGGPGAPAFIFAARRHHGNTRQPLTGWHGHAAPFEFRRDYAPADGIRQMQTGTQPVASLALVEPGIDLALRAGIDRIREKSVALTAEFIRLVEERLAGFGFSVASPREARRRGSQVALQHADGYPIVRALETLGVICDYREPDLLRFGFAPLYNRYVDAWDAVERLHGVLDSGAWQDPGLKSRRTVT